MTTHYAPVCTVWAACEDVLVLEKIHSGAYAIDNLHELDEAMARCLDIGGVKLPRPWFSTPPKAAFMTGVRGRLSAPNGGQREGPATLGSLPASAVQAQQPSTSGTPDAAAKPEEEVKSPGGDAGSTGTRTPETGTPPRHPWTIFMRMPPNLQVTQAEFSEFFVQSKEGITHVNLPHSFAGKGRLAYVEFGDEGAMKAGLEEHAKKLNDITPDVKQATDSEMRGESPRHTRPPSR
ncbi:hypothetical protein HYPSUDRAFT_59036 [Hypholoma sublateritium FD-334 SS-4]|uniref:Uncharacterized protein n=1 Tax=Hypholoma sublateritium (strain FD-334 SS-4) TaxID=945553 RepID=A0A0D2KK27_HYPSF|nr:hypothetical protein HYPSUDRAFT_59036 [Hypholoma sublateritium FD-334 SS-4]